MTDFDRATELAISTLVELASEGFPEERIKAATVLIQATLENRQQTLREEMAAAILPLLKTLGGNLAGTLPEETPVGLALNLTPLEQGNLLLQLTKAIEFD
jgi:hypothetical protein